MRVLIANDHAVVRRGLREILESASYDVCCEAADGQEAAQLVSTCRPDILVLNINMPVMSGLNAAREVRRVQPDLPIVLLSSKLCMEIHAVATKTLGIRGFVSKSRAAFDVINAIEKVSCGQTYFAP